MPAAALLIAAHNLMAALQEQVDVTGEVLRFADNEPIQALQAIMQYRPPLIVLERLFAATPRGAALINRIKNDPSLGVCEVRVMSHTGDYARQVVKPSQIVIPPLIEAVEEMTAAEEQADASVATVETVRLDWQGTRRAPRHRVRAGLEIQLDGNSATIIDLSIFGAQVVSGTVLRPNQKVRISLPGDEFVMRFRAGVAWAKFELAHAQMKGPHYRAGLEFMDADASAIEQFCAKNKENAGR
jgi:PilZ domain-containing protein